MNGLYNALVRVDEVTGLQASRASTAQDNRLSITTDDGNSFEALFLMNMGQLLACKLAMTNN